MMFTMVSLFVNVASAQADGKVKMKLNYNVGMPLGDFRDNYISNRSFNGANGEISYTVNKGVSLGLNVGYQSYYQKYPRASYKTTQDQTISAVLSNTVELMPVMVNGTLLPLSGAGKLQPYVSGGVGVNLINYRQYYGEFSEGNASTAFAAQAGAGVMMPLGKNKASALQVGATYNYTPYKNNGLKNLNTLGVQLGIVFPLK